MSTYLINKSPEKYGGHQELYLQRVNEIVNKSVDQFRQAIQDNDNLVALFHRTLNEMGEFRHALAVDHETPNARYFGSRRDLNYENNCSITPLFAPYEEYNEILLSKIQKQLSKMKHTTKELLQKKLKVEGEKCLGKSSRMEIEILDKTMLEKLNRVTDREYCIQLSKFSDVSPPSNELPINDFLKELISNKQAMLNLKKHSPEDYKILKLHSSIAHICGISVWEKWRKSDWVYITIRSEIDGKMYSLSQYITWIYRTFQEDPIEHMTGRAGITILHQDPLLIESMLADIAKIFERALQWDGNDLVDLKNSVALLHYELSHAMPFQRGSAAIAEWIEKAIYQFHNFNLTYAPSKMLDLEAITSLLPEFVENYDSMINLESNIQ